LTNIRLTLKDVLNINIDMHRELFRTYLKNIPHGREWEQVIIPIKNALKKRKSSTQSIITSKSNSFESVSLEQTVVFSE
jgi:hypothetical protein